MPIAALHFQLYSKTTFKAYSTAFININIMTTMFKFTTLIICMAMPMTLLAEEAISTMSTPASYGKSLKESTAFAGQTATSGGKFFTEGTDDFLELWGVKGPTFAVTDPTDPETMYPIEHWVVEQTFPRFSVLMVNNSNTSVAAGARHNPSAVPWTSFILLDMVHNDDETIRYKVDIVNSSNVDNQKMTNFDAGMMLMDLTAEGHAVDDKQQTVDGDHSKSLAWLMDNTQGLETGPVPLPMNGTRVQAQGVFSTAFLGPFNAWAWACCGYKIATAWTVILPWSWIFWPVCCL